MIESIKQATIRGLAWSLMESVALQGIRFLVGIVLARMLMPEAFGLVAMLMLFLALGEIFLDSGFGAALIQKRTVTDLDICSVFYFNLLVGLVATGLLCFTAPWIAAFYNQPILTPLTRALSLIFVINSLGQIQGTLLTKRVDFKSQAKVSAIGGLFSGVIGISLASMGFGVWSLVGQQISASAIRSILFWFFSSWRPSLVFRLDSLREMLGFGLRVLATGLLNRTSQNIYYLVIGRVFTVARLGYFHRANTLQELPSGMLAFMVARVAFPVFSKLQDDPIRLKRGFRRALTTLSLLNFPMMIGLSLVARPLVLVLLTDKWSEAIPYLQLLCVVGMLLPVEWISLSVLQAVGRSDLALKVESLKKLVLFGGLAVTWRWGIIGIIGGMILASVIAMCLNIHYTAKLTRYSPWQQVHDMFVYFMVACAMGIVIFITGYVFSDHNPLLQLAVQVFSGLIFYLGASRLLRLAAFMDILQEVWTTLSTRGFRTSWGMTKT